jgi:hypothetical protein
LFLFSTQISVVHKLALFYGQFYLSVG